ncbi:MAG: DMT family transporter [Patescibacteria group bacterium]
MNSKKSQTNVPLIGSFSTRTLAIGCLIIVAAAYSLLSVGSRLLAEGFMPMTQVYMRVALGTFILLVLLRNKLRWSKIISMPSRDLLILSSMGTIGFSIAVYFVTLGALNAKLVNVAIIFSSVPFFSYLYAYIFLKKPLNAKLIGLLALSLIGIVIVATKSFIPQLGAFGTGEWFTLLATATMAWFYVGRKLLSNHLNTSEITIIVMAIATITAVLFALTRGESFTLSAFTNPHVLLGLFIGGGMNALVNPIEIFAFDHLDAVTGSQILLLDTVFALLFGYLFYQELITFPEVIGGLIVISSVYLANKFNK